VLHGLRTQRGRIRAGDYDYLAPRYVARLARLWLLDRIGRRRYRLVSEGELRAFKSSDTAFVFGSGRSLLDITPKEWEAIGRFDVVSLREFPRQHWVRATFHLSSEVDFIEEYAQRIRENPLYADTVFVVQGGLRGEAGNELIGRGLLPRGARVFRFRRTSRSAYAPPSRTPGVLVHGYNSIIDATNFAVALGYRRIVLVGADYYNKEYFWLPAGETRAYEKPGIDADTLFTGHEPIVGMLGRWSELLAQESTELSVFNARSLLAQRLPVFDRASLG
jgi:hypothetical protein